MSLLSRLSKSLYLKIRMTMSQRGKLQNCSHLIWWNDMLCASHSVGVDASRGVDAGWRESRFLQGAEASCRCARCPLCAYGGLQQVPVWSPMAFGRFVLASPAPSIRLLADPDLIARYLLHDEEHGSVSRITSNELSNGKCNILILPKGLWSSLWLYTLLLLKIEFF